MKKIADVVGVDKLASQYLNQDRRFERDFNKISNVDFDTFASIMNSIYNLARKEKDNGITQDEKAFLNKRISDVNNFADRLLKEKMINISQIVMMKDKKYFIIIPQLCGG